MCYQFISLRNKGIKGFVHFSDTQPIVSVPRASPSSSSSSPSPIPTPLSAPYFSPTPPTPNPTKTPQPNMRVRDGTSSIVLYTQFFTSCSFSSLNPVSLFSVLRVTNAPQIPTHNLKVCGHPTHPQHPNVSTVPVHAHITATLWIITIPPAAGCLKFFQYTHIQQRQQSWIVGNLTFSCLFFCWS